MTLRNALPTVFLSLGGFAGGLTIVACDPGMKDLGDETETAGDDGGTADGGACTPGDMMPAPDGCNTCVCSDDGQWACTEMGCVDDGGGTGGGECTPGDTMPAPDGCNTCTCGPDGLWACTLLGCEDTGDGGSDDGSDTAGACTPGDMMPAPDGCNTCECTDGGEWACTEEACDPPWSAILCEPAEFNFSGVTAAAVQGDTLALSVQYSGGCEEHFFALCWDGAFAESEPVQAWVGLNHSGPPDPCDSIVDEDIEIDLTPMRDAWNEYYGAGSGTMILHVDGWPSSLTYSW